MITYRRLHLGCGLNTPDGWINVDGSWNAWASKYRFFYRCLTMAHILPIGVLDVAWDRRILIHDVRKRLPFKSNSMVVIYSSHLLEHLYLDEATKLLKECYRVLNHGGIIRVVVPDLHHLVQCYLDDNWKRDSKNQSNLRSSADMLNAKLLLRSPIPPPKKLLYRMYSSYKDFHSHKWMYDAPSAILHMVDAGFSDVKQMDLYDSKIDDIESVEMPERIINGAGICIEGVKLG